MDKLIHYLEGHMLSCFYKKYLGIACPGCGFQRSLLHLLKGEFVASLKAYPALLPTLFMVLFLFLHIVFKFKFGAKLLLYLFIGNTSVVLISYIVKLILHEI